MAMQAAQQPYEDYSSSPASISGNTNQYHALDKNPPDEESKTLKDKVYTTFKSLAQRKSKGMLFDMSDVLERPKAFGVDVPDADPN